MAGSSKVFNLKSLNYMFVNQGDMSNCTTLARELIAGLDHLLNTWK